jgi:hypothetical protein
MFRNRTFKILSNLILLVALFTGQVAAAPNNSTNKVKGFPSLTFTNCAAQAQIPAAECDALVAHITIQTARVVTQVGYKQIRLAVGMG